MARSPDDAADLTQGFFLRAFEKDFFAGFDPSRARFRTYLRTCLDGFVANARKADARLKRGGGVTLIPIDFDEAERELRLPGGQRDRRLRRLLSPRVAAQPVRGRGRAAARRVRGARPDAIGSRCSSSTIWRGR